MENTAEFILSPKDEAHIWRSKFFDQSSRCEARLRRIYAFKHPTEPIPHQFKAVSVAVRKSSDCETSDEKLTAAIDELLPLIELRAYLAHSAMRLMSLNGDHVVAFAQTGGDQQFGQKVMMLTSTQRATALKRLTSLADRFKRYLNAT